MPETIIRASRDCVATPDKRQMTAMLNLIGLVTGHARLVVAPDFSSRRSRWCVFDARNCCLRRADLRLGFGCICFSGRMQFVAEFILGLLEFFDRRTHPTCQL